LKVIVRWNGLDLINIFIHIKVSFFSFKSNLDSSTTIWSRNEKSAIYDSKDEKISFGRDLQIFNKTCVLTNYKRKIITPKTFDIEDYEVFQVEQIEQYI
jgi:hypothetical protein